MRVAGFTNWMAKSFTNSWDLMGFNADLMGFYGDLMGMNGI